MNAARTELVEKARQLWIKRLIDLSRRNNLLYFRALKNGTLNLNAQDHDALISLLSGKSTPVSKLLPDEKDSSLSAKLREISRRALTNAEEKGLKTLFVALGMASWKTQDEGRPPESPVLLLPVVIEGQGRERHSFSLRSDGPLQVNLVLLHVLEDSFGIKLSDEDVLPENGHHDESNPFDPLPVYERLRQLAREVPEFKVEPHAVLSNFAFQKMAMVRDLQAYGAQMEQSDLVAGLAGDIEARSRMGKADGKLDPAEIDRQSPDTEFQILDADSSQQCAMAAALKGQSTVIHGPPGTGKSQTIANLIASLAAKGSRVLFVAEKRAALEAVFKRLEQVQLGHLAMDLHGADVSPRRVMEQIARNLDMVRHSAEVDCEKLHQRYMVDRDRLNGHVQRVHQKRNPCGKSVYELQGLLLRLQAQFECGVRWREADLKRIGLKEADKIRDLLIEAGGFEPLFLGNSTSPWNGTSILDESSAQRAIDLAVQLSEHDWAECRHAISNVAQSARLAEPRTVAEADNLFELVSQVQRTWSLYSPEIWKQDFALLLRELLPATRGTLALAWAWCTRKGFRASRKLARSLRQDPNVSSAQLWVELTAIAEQKSKWQALSSAAATPVNLPEFANSNRQFTEAKAKITEFSKFFTVKNHDGQTLDEVGALISRLASDLETPHQIPKTLSIQRDLQVAGAGAFVAFIRSRLPQAKQWPQLFDYAWYASCLDAARVEDPEIGGFNGRTHDQFVEEFRRLDRERIMIAAARVRRAHAQRAIEAMNQHTDEEQLVRRESEKKTRHLPLRKLVARAPEVLTALCPCWMASPLSVSQLLEGDKRYFDAVVFDEASQILPEDSVPAILRCAQVVVAGDTNQLPPTTFFATGGDDDSDEENTDVGTEGFESLLDVTNAFLPSKYLDWHYRSRDEALIGFSNHHIYQDRLITFPGIGGPPAISHILVEQQPGQDGQEESSDAEIRRVVALVLEHARKKPDASLGIITMGIRHRDRIQRALDEALKDQHSLSETFFDPNRPERFFVKNLERVQGDEREAIILSVGYGKDRAGNLPFRFGPLLAEGGRRRLNVAVTRARQQMTLVSSFNNLDMDPARIKPNSGVELLRDYIQYAATHGMHLAEAHVSNFPLNDFEAAVYDVLTAAGIPLESQVGASGYRIDFVAKHPEKPGRFVLAIECDGATYHSSATARDRDRLRQQQLENLGWRFHRIWSTDWFTRKQEETERALKAYHAAVDYANQRDSGQDVPVKEVKASANPKPEAATAQETPVLFRRKLSRPMLGRRDSIDDYKAAELASLVRWIKSDGELRTDEQIIHEMIAELGFARRGPRIEAALEQALIETREEEKN